MKTVLFAADHAGFALKETLKPYVESLGYTVRDFGALHHEDGDDYVDYIAPLAEAVSKNPDNARGIILGGSGQGEAIVANRFPRVRAAVFYGKQESIPALSREHNDANILSLGARFITEDEAKKAVKEWLDTPFSGDERHVRRIGKIDQHSVS